MPGIIAHIDMNKYYAGVEQMLDPTLKNRPIAVCGSADDRHGIVLTASAEAKARGVKTGMANWEARAACPGLIVVPPHYDQYLKYSRLARDIYREYTARIEPYGLDECWVDFTDICRDFDDAEQMANTVRERVKAELGLTVSIGVSFNKVFAKLGSDMKKPDAVTMLPPDDWQGRVWRLSAAELLFVGHHTMEKLARRAIFTIGDLARTNPELLQSFLGKNGLLLWRYANGLDTSRVMPDGYEREVESVGHGITCVCDLNTELEVWRVIYELCQDIGHRLRRHRLYARGVRLQIRMSDLSGAPGRQAKLPYATQSPAVIAKAARQLFAKGYAWPQSVRAVTVTAIDLVDEAHPVQLDMLGEVARRERRERAEDCVDHLRERFGPQAVTAAILLGDKHMPGDKRHLVRMPDRPYE